MHVRAAHLSCGACNCCWRGLRLYASQLTEVGRALCSCVAVWQHDRVEVIPNDQVRCLTFGWRIQASCGGSITLGGTMVALVMWEQWRGGGAGTAGWTRYPHVGSLCCILCQVHTHAYCQTCMWCNVPLLEYSLAGRPMLSQARVNCLQEA